MKVNVENVSLIRPISHSHQRFKLSFFDHVLWFIHYRTRFLFYPNPACISNHPSAIASTLKHSLSRALVDFFPFAGRLKVQENGCNMHLDCSGAGAQFIEAYTDLAMADLGDFRLLSLLASQELSQTAGHVLLWPWSPETPLLFIQLTRFACGGLCIAFKWCHQISDGTSIWQFIQSWSAIARGEGVCFAPDISYSPKLCSFPDNKDLEILEPYCLQTRKRAKMPRNIELTIHNSIVTHCFSFSRDQVLELKRQAGQKLGQERLSTFQVVSAHIWHHISKARGLADDEITRLIFVLSCRRNRLDGLSDSYFGNAIVPVSSKLKAGNLVENEYLGVEAIRVAIKNATIQEDLLNICRIMKRYTEDAEETILMPVNSGCDVYIASSNTFPVYENDFGFGRPQGLAIPPLFADGRVYYFPGKEKGSVEAFIGLDKDVMEILKSDVFFTTPLQILQMNEALDVSCLNHGNIGGI